MRPVPRRDNPGPAASPTTRKSLDSAREAIESSSSSASALTGATWRPGISRPCPDGLGHRAAQGLPERPGLCNRLLGQVQPGQSANRPGPPRWRAPRLRPGDPPCQPAHGAGQGRRAISAYRSDGAQIAVIYPEKPPSCQIIEAESGKLVRSIVLPALGESVAWSPDGTTLATPCDDRKIYLWDAATGIRRATLEGSTSIGLRAAFHPAGTLLASNGWEGRLRLWDPVLGRPVLSVTSNRWPEFSKEGRIVIAFEDRLTAYQVDPALEYRTFAHASSEPIDYRSAAIHRDGRLLAVGHEPGSGDLGPGTRHGARLPAHRRRLASDVRGLRRLADLRLDRRAAVARSGSTWTGKGIPHRPAHSTPVAGGRLWHRRGPNGPHHGVGRP